MKYFLHVNKRKLIVYTVTLIYIFTGCSGRENNIKNRETETLKIKIEQDGIEKELVNNEAAIYRKPFTIKFIFRGNDNIFVNASFSPESYIAAEEGKPVNKIPGYSGTVVSEELFNRDEMITVSDTAQNFWHYTNENNNSFNEVIKENGTIICSRKISQLEIDAPEKNKIQLADIIKDAIFLVFMKLEWNRDFSNKIEKSRKTVKLTFINPDRDKSQEKSDKE